MAENSSCVPGDPVPNYDYDDSNYSSTDYDSLQPALVYPAWEVALKVTFYVLAIVLDLGGNSIVIMIILLNRKMRTTTNLLILNLAVSDLMVGTFCMWVHLGNQISSNWPFGAFLCKFSTFSQVMSVTASVLTLTVISVERFIAVVYPFRRHWTPVVTGIIIGCTWILAIATASPQLAVKEMYVVHWKDRTEIWCAENWPLYYKDAQCTIYTPGKIIYYFLEGVVMFFVPVAILIITYTVIAFKLLMRKPPGSLITTTSSAQEKAKRKVTKMLVIVMIVFICCWTPQQTMLLYDLYEVVEGTYYPKLRYVAIYMAYFNSALNPILYGGFNENFRSGFVEAFRCFLIKKRNKIGPESTMPPWSNKPPDGRSTDLKVVSATQFTPYSGHSGHASPHLHPNTNYLQLPSFQRGPRTSTNTGPGRDASVHSNNGHQQSTQPALQRETTTLSLTAPDVPEEQPNQPDRLCLTLQTPAADMRQESHA